MSGEHGIIEDGMYMGYERMGCIWEYSRLGLDRMCMGGEVGKVQSLEGQKCDIKGKGKDCLMGQVGS